MSARIEQTAWVPRSDPTEVLPEETAEYWLAIAQDFEAEGSVLNAAWALDRAVEAERLPC